MAERSLDFERSVLERANAWHAKGVGRSSIFELPARMGINLTYKPSGPDLLGLVLKYNGEHSIFINQAVRAFPLLHAAVLGHEIGHVLAGVEGLAQCGPGGGTDVDSEIERRAWHAQSLLAVPSDVAAEVARGELDADVAATVLDRHVCTIRVRADLAVLLGEIDGDRAAAWRRYDKHYAEAISILEAYSQAIAREPGDVVPLSLEVDPRIPELFERIARLQRNGESVEAERLIRQVAELTRQAAPA